MLYRTQIERKCRRHSWQAMKSSLRRICPNLVLASSSIALCNAFLDSSSNGLFEHSRVHRHRQQDGCCCPSICSTAQYHDRPPDPTGFREVFCSPPPFAECFNATSWSVNPHDADEVNNLLRCFNSPAPQTYFAFTRALSLPRAPLDEKDHLIDVLRTFSPLLKKGYQFRVGGNGSMREKFDPFRGEKWRIVSTMASQTNDDVWHPVSSHQQFPSTLSIAHHLLDTAMDSNQDSHIATNKTQLIQHRHHLEGLAVHRLQLTLGVDIRGRSAADAAFALAMAGVTCHQLYDMLTEISYHELRRIGRRPSFPSKYVLQIVEKLAAAGVRGHGASRVNQLAATLLREKQDAHYHQQVIESLEKAATGKRHHDGFGLHSTWPLLWLWRFAARQTKAHTFAHSNDMKQSEKILVNESYSAQRCDETKWKENFVDASRPLVVDIGCGMGVSLLGLATLNSEENDDRNTPLSSLASFGASCNYLGVDLSRHLSFAKGIARRWEIADRLQFCRMSAVDTLQSVREMYHPGRVALIMIQFPTPFKLRNAEGEINTRAGNKQLPSDEESGFMVTSDLLRLASLLLNSGGFLLLQSNCEDVAIELRRMAEEEAGFECIQVEPHVSELPGVENPALPQRSREYVQRGGDRPIGPGWLSSSVLPRVGHTETEVHCTVQGTPVHRCLLRVAARKY